MLRSILGMTLAAFAVALLAGGGATVSGQGKQPDKSTLEKVSKALPDKAPAEAKQRRKILIYSKTAGFRHDSIAIGARTIEMMGDKTGAFTVMHTENEALFEPEKLKTFDAVLMLNTTGDCLRPKGGSKEDDLKREEVYKKALVDFVASGKGLIGIHAAGDTYHNWKDYTRMMGGTFQSHPWTQNSKVSIKVQDPDNPINAAFGGKGFDITDEIYVFRAGTALPDERRYLLSLDEKKMDVAKGKRADGLYPISWISTIGKGRNFYCSLGHRQDIYYNPAILKHYLAGIQYALGDLQADASPVKK